MWIGEPLIGGTRPVFFFYLDDEGGLERVRAQIKETCDLLDCERRAPSDAVGGWVMPEDLSETGGRSSGRFRVEFPQGTISGTYDTSE